MAPDRCGIQDASLDRMAGASLFQVLKTAFKDWSEDQAPRLAAAAALAGPGLDAAHIRVTRPGPTPSNRLALVSEGAYGTVSAQVVPRVAPGVHPVAASILAALRQHRTVVWVG